MTSRPSSTFAAFAAAAAIVLPCILAPALPGQELALSRAVVDRAFTLRTEAPGVPAVLAGLPARADVTAGFSVQSSGAAGTANVSGSLVWHDQALHCMLSANCLVGAGVPGASATVGQPSVIVELSVPRAMVVRFATRAATITGPGTPSFRGVVDVAADGQPELDFVSRPGASGSLARTIELALPPGRLAIRLAVDLALPGAAVGRSNQFSCMFAQVIVEPAHATIESQGSGCGAAIEATPMLDGTNVRFGVFGGSWSPAAWLVLGPSPAAVTLPISPACPLLVTPDVVLPISPSTRTLLPLALLGPIELFAQGVVLRSPTPWDPAPQLLTSSRLRLQLH